MVVTYSDIYWAKNNIFVMVVYIFRLLLCLNNVETHTALTFTGFSFWRYNTHSRFWFRKCLNQSVWCPKYQCPTVYKCLPYLQKNKFHPDHWNGKLFRLARWWKHVSINIFTVWVLKFELFILGKGTTSVTNIKFTKVGSWDCQC